MRHTDARVSLLRYKVDAVVDAMLNRNLDGDVDNLDHYLLSTLRQPYIDIAVFNKVAYYVNNVIANFNLKLKW